MKRFTRLVAGACVFASMLLASCHAPHESISDNSSYKSNHSPQFISNIAMGGNSSTIGMNGIVKKRELEQDDAALAASAEIDPAQANAIQKKYATILGVRPKAITNWSLYSFIDEWYGVDYRLGGSDKNGIDCSAFVQKLYEQVFGVNLVRTAFEQFNNCSLLTRTDEIKEGDLVFFHTHGRRISHVGIYLMNSFFVHASASQGVMISSLNESYWQRHFSGAGEIPLKGRG